MSYNLFLLAFALGIGGGFQYGLQISVTNSPAEYIKSFIHETWVRRYGYSATEELITLMWSFIVSVYSIGGLLGSLSAGYLSVRFGRKKTMLLANIPTVLSAALMGLSRLCGSFEMIIAGRLFSGVGGGTSQEEPEATNAFAKSKFYFSYLSTRGSPKQHLSSRAEVTQAETQALQQFSPGLALSTHLMFAGESAPRNLRGPLAITASTAIALGKFAGFALGLREVLGVDALWPVLMAAHAVPALVQLLTLPFFPDSPRYLLIDKKDKEGCIKALKQLWGDGDHMAEIDDMLAEQEAIHGEKAKSVCDLFRDQAVRWQLITLSLVVACMQFNGAGVVYFYAYDIFIKAGIPHAQAHYVSLGLGTTEILTTVVSGLLVERAGRKILLWKSHTVMALALGLLTVTLSLQDSFSWVPYCSVALIFIFVMSFGVGPAAVACSLPTEIFIQSYRPAAYVLNGASNWTQLFILGFLFPFIVEGLGSLSFIIFVIYCLSTAIFVFMVMPETKGKTILQVMEEFNHLNYRGKKRQTALPQSNRSVMTVTRL